MLGDLLLRSGRTQARTAETDKREIVEAEDAWRTARIDGDAAFLSASTPRRAASKT
ncbi:hypothetical protein [Novosphingobium sp. 9U]|uniref:hypothetical protein n=1 Tax=Novosphingobium sp. 9U TaxID=2653158 RepID=UPI0012F40A8E|nr:hypothetical protein [Novosphingobium sp. 9U]VWX52292.1 hypothetical protein NOVOSPHI9U_40745 [Novosphingobium sp. 9U]